MSIGNIFIMFDLYYNMNKIITTKKFDQMTNINL